MSPGMDSNSSSSNRDNSLVELIGADGTPIGNVGDRLKVDIASIASGNIPAWPNTLCYCDMNVSTGGVARGTSITTTWTDVYSYSGSGYVAGFILNLETFTQWKVRFLVDGNDIFNSTDGFTSEDLAGDTIYDVDDVTDSNQASLGLSKGSHDRLVFASPLRIPTRYTSSVVVKVARVSGTKKFQSGLMVLSK
jgi:hypothetical protein